MKRKQVAFLLVIIVVASGCMGSDPGSGSTADPTGSSLVEPEPGVKVREGLGVLRGKVLSDQGAGLVGARVSLLETDFFADTNRSGGFLFLNVTPGPRHLVVQASGFQPYEATVDVVAGNVTTHVAQMVPSVSTGAGYRPHQHDFWRDRTQVDIMDDDVDLTSPGANRGTAVYSGAYATLYKPNSNGTDDTGFRFGIPKRENDDNLVFPGTKELRVKFIWTVQDVTLDKLGLAYVHANATTRTYLPLKASGEEWVIRTAPDMWDTGHQEFTLWSFFIHSGNSLMGKPENWKPGLILDKIHVKMTVVRGELDFEPAHVDHWGGKSELSLRNKTQETRPTQANPSYGDPMDLNYMIGLPQGKLVPPGTIKLRVEFWWSYQPTGGVDTNAAPGYYDYVLTWRTGAQEPATTELSEFKRAAPTETKPGYKLYEIELGPGETDAFYQKKSVWRWRPSPAGFEDSYDQVEARGRVFKVEITAYKDPAFDAGV